MQNFISSRFKGFMKQLLLMGLLSLILTVGSAAMVFADFLDANISCFKKLILICNDDIFEKKKIPYMISIENRAIFLALEYSNHHKICRCSLDQFLIASSILNIQLYERLFSYHFKALLSLDQFICLPHYHLDNYLTKAGAFFHLCR